MAKTAKPLMNPMPNATVMKRKAPTPFQMAGKTVRRFGRIIGRGVTKAASKAMAPTVRNMKARDAAMEVKRKEAASGEYN